MIKEVFLPIIVYCYILIINRSAQFVSILEAYDICKYCNIAGTACEPAVAEDEDGLRRWIASECRCQRFLGPLVDWER